MVYVGAKGEGVHLRFQDTSVLRVYHRGELVCAIAFTPSDGLVNIQIEHEGRCEVEEKTPTL